MTAASRSLAEWLAFQQRVHPRAIDLGLTRVRAVAERLELLPVAGRSLIVGGTNGKGSTATTVAALLTACGERTGLFTSPHLTHYRERIRIDGVLADDRQLVTAFEQIEAARGEQSLTFFEYNTLAALLLFRSAGVTATVLEVGLGGRLDATNLMDAQVAILCSVGLDHTDWLGKTLESIGHEKAGIFRRNQPVILGDSAMPEAVHQQARQLSCSVRQAQIDFHWQVAADGSWTYADAIGSVSPLPAPRLGGPIQYRNAAMAVAALRALPGLPLAGATQLAIGLRAVQLSGRLQRIAGPVEWLLDVAHNPSAATELVIALRALPPARRTVAVCGMLADKDVAGVVATLDPHVDHWLFCTIDAARGLQSGELQQRAGSVRGSAALADSVADGCARALSASGDRVIVFGSFHTVGPALQWLGLY